MADPHTLFKAPQHFYQGGRRKPVNPEEEKLVRKQVRKSWIWLFLMAVIVMTGFLYFIGLGLAISGIRVSAIMRPLAIIWAAFTIALFIIFTRRHVKELAIGEKLPEPKKENPETKE